MPALTWIFSYDVKNIDCHVIFVTIYVPYTILSDSVIHSFLWVRGGGLFNIFSLKGGAYLKLGANSSIYGNHIFCRE